MPLRFHDDDRTLDLGVRDLVDAAPPSGHLTLDAPQRRVARLAAGRAAHEAWQEERQQEDAAFQRERTLRHTLLIEGWTVTLHGRVDGLIEEAGRTVVEELKSTALDAARLLATTAQDWPAWAAQLEAYQWLLAGSAFPEPTGRLVLTSLLDGARHVIGLQWQPQRIDAWVRSRLTRLIEARERRLAWLRRRRGFTVPPPFSAWRAGQERISRATAEALTAGRRLLVEAPTGLGKTAAVLHGALCHALRHDRQIFWATSRNTQGQGLLDAVAQLQRRGLALRVVHLRSREALCLNEVVACHPDTCAFARDHHDKVATAGLLDAAPPALSMDAARALGEQHRCCPHALTVDLARDADVVVGDVSLALSPHARQRRLLPEDGSGDWVLVVDEAHGLPERARGWESPQVDADAAQAAHSHALGKPGGQPFAELAEDVLRTLERTRRACDGPWQRDEAEATLDPEPWLQLARRVDELALEQALWRARRGIPDPHDPWPELARQVLRLADNLSPDAEADPGILTLLRRHPSTSLRQLCLDPSKRLGARFAAFGGVVAVSATLSPAEFYLDVLGLPDASESVRVASPFPAERRAVFLAPRISTAFRDRPAQADPTARLLSACIEATPGHTALFFPSFAMLDDIVPRLSITREVRAQSPGMADEARQAALDALHPSRPPIVLAGVLGGIFAEGVDPPPGALRGVFVISPGLPPIGLERDRLRAAYEQRFGQGFRYASLIPGLTRVVQAAGRLIRRPEDRGVILLVDRRFRWRDVRTLLPPDWDPSIPDDPAAAIRDFWASAT